MEVDVAKTDAAVDVEKDSDTTAASGRSSSSARSSSDSTRCRGRGMPDGDAMPLTLPLWPRRETLPWCEDALLPWLGDSADCNDGLASAAAEEEEEEGEEEYTGDETLC